MANRSRHMSEKSNTSVVTKPERSGEKEFFWSVVLSAEKRSVTWIVASEEGEEDELDHTLFLKAAVLGGNAVTGEQNVVVFQSPGEDGKIQKGVIANLTRGLNPMTTLDLTVPGRLGGTLVLSEGSGPVTIAGNHLIESVEHDQNDDTQTDMEATADELDESEEEEEKSVDKKETKNKAGAGAKRKGAQAVTKQKKAKTDVEAEDDDDDEEEDFDIDDDDDEDDDDYEDVKSKKNKKKKVVAGKADKGKNKSDKEPGKKVKAGKK